MDNYTIYHLHSDLSNGVTNIDSITKYYEYISKANELGMKSLGFSEHGSIFEWVHKKTKTEECGIKYIHSQEFYVTETLDTKVRDNYHCILIAKNFEGVKELNILSSKAFNKEDGHFYYVPRLSLQELFGISDNIIVTSACIGGLLNSNSQNIKQQYLDFFINHKDNCYLEVQHHNDISQIEYNKTLAKLSDKYNIPLIAGTDTHALNDTHILGRKILQLSKNINFENEGGWDLTFKTLDELVECYKKQNSLPQDYYLQAISNTNAMADRIEEFKLDYTAKYPKLYDDNINVLKKKIVEGIKRRNVDKLPNFNEYKQRIQYELDTYIYNNAIDFVLLEEDYKRAMREKNINCGYSRGSVSGSLIAYLLGITEVDSIRFDLNFERFMNKERISLADVDTDWYKSDRGEIRKYLFENPKLHCCDIITFNTIALKGAIKDVGRALDMPIEQTQEISDAVFLDDNKKFKIDQKYRDEHKELFEYVDIVSGTIVSVGSHPAGLVVSPYEVDSSFGTFRTSTNENPISQINMKEIDSLNYIKLDILGLDCVGLINETCKIVGIDILTPDNMNFIDMNVWNDLSEDTTLIFQFESDFAGGYLKNILRKDIIEKIKSANKNFSYIDLMSMANGAIRPAGMSYRTELAEGIHRDNGHEALNEFLSPTLGYLVYQEQIIEFLNKFCGFTMGEADIVRRNFSKKLGTEKDMPKIKQGFNQTMLEKYNISEEKSNELIENFIKVIEDASSYLFSKNHADPYSFLGFACAYLRHYYPLEFLTTALNIYQDDSDKSLKIQEYINNKGIEIKPIEFGHSKDVYWFDKNTNSIYKGISSIKYCNAQIANELLELSKNKYNNFVDLLTDIKTKTSLDARQLKILTGLNFFKIFGCNKYLLNIIDIYDNFYNKKQIKKSELDSLGLSEFLMTKFSLKETAALYKELDNNAIINHFISKLKNESMSVVESVKFDIEYLEYTTYINPNVSDKFYIVVGFTTYKNKCKPYLVLRQIKTGEEIKTKIKDEKAFIESSFEQFSVIKVEEFKQQYKTKNIGGVWKKVDELEDILTNWVVVK